MSGVVSRWLGGVDALENIAQRLMRVQIENRPATNIIELYDHTGTFFFVILPIFMQREAIPKPINSKWMRSTITSWLKYCKK